MVKSTVKLAWIPDDSKRRATFRKRKVSLLKKICELCILCAVKGCMVLYGPSDDTTAVTWPDMAEATGILLRFLEMPEMERSKKMLNQEGFVRQRIQKILQQLAKIQRYLMDLHLEYLLNQWLIYTPAVADSAGSPVSGTYEMMRHMDVTNGLQLNVINEFVRLLDRKLWSSGDKLQGLAANQPTVMAGADGLQPPPPSLLQLPPPAMVQQHVDMAVEGGLNQMEMGTQVEMEMAAASGEAMIGRVHAAASGTHGDAVPSPSAPMTDFSHHGYSTMLEYLMTKGSQELFQHHEGSSSSQFQNPWYPEPPV